MKRTKKPAKNLTNEQLLEELKQYIDEHGGGPVPAPYIPPVVVCPGHDHCTCPHCHPQPWTPPWTIGPYYTMIGTGISDFTVHC